MTVPESFTAARDLILHGALMRTLAAVPEEGQDRLWRSVRRRFRDAEPGRWSLDLGEHYAGVCATMTDGYVLVTADVVPWSDFPTAEAACRARGMCAREAARVAVAEMERRQAATGDPLRAEGVSR